jgi:hypothetical protein
MKLDSARKIVSVTLILWALLFVIALVLLRQPEVVLLPLYGLYPGKINYQAEQLWAVGSGFVFLTLALIGIFRKSKMAAVAFMVLFFLSMGGWILRFAHSIDSP